MRYACTTCGKERFIPVTAAWPSCCDACGGTAWTSAPATEMKSLVNLGDFDPASAASGLLRQPGSAYDAFRNPGAIHTLT